jgi:hypothetical protein
MAYTSFTDEPCIRRNYVCQVKNQPLPGRLDPFSEVVLRRMNRGLSFLKDIVTVENAFLALSTD